MKVSDLPNLLESTSFVFVGGRKKGLSDADESVGGNALKFVGAHELRRVNAATRWPVVVVGGGAADQQGGGKQECR